MTRSDLIEAAAERAAIMEYDGGLPRALAMYQAAKAWGVAIQEIEAFLSKRDELMKEVEVKP